MLGDNEDETTAFKEFLQQVTNEVARCLGSAIGESAAKIQNLESRELDLQKQIKALEDAAMKSDYDGLTEVLNRQGWLRRAAHLFGLCQKHQTGCALGFLDIDSFKSINDTRGHVAGDTVLIKVAQSLQQVLGNHGVAGRIGGDEFVFALIAKDEAEAQTIVEQLQAAIRVQRIEITPDAGAPPAPPVHVTTSVGSFWIGIPSPKLTVDAALKAADELMYQAKKGGKACCAFGRLKTAA